MPDIDTRPVSEAEMKAFLVRIATMEDFFNLPDETLMIQGISTTYNQIRHAAVRLVTRMQVNHQLEE